MTIYVDKFEIVTRRNGVKRSKKNKEKKEKYLKKLEELADQVEDLGADYIITGTERGYVIERKSISDLLSSVFHSESKTSGRLFDQVKRIVELANELTEKEGIKYTPILIIEGNLKAHNNAARKRGGKPVNLAVYRGIIVSVMEIGAHVVETKDFMDTVDFLQLLDKRAGKPKKISGLNVKKGLRSLEEEAVHMIYAVSRIGPKKAKELLEKYGTVKNVVNLDETTLKRELGPKTGEHFYKVVNTSFKKYRDLKR